MITREQFDQISNCRESLAYVASQPSLAAAWENCERPDWLLTFARKAEIASKEQFVRMAIGEAEVVLHIWTAKYPDDDRPQKAIKAAKDCLGDKTSERSATAYAAAAEATYYARAAKAAHDASADKAAYAAESAAYAAYAAYDASATTAAYYAAATYDAAKAAYFSAKAAEDKDAFQRAQCNRIRAIIPNPFVESRQQ